MARGIESGKDKRDPATSAALADRVGKNADEEGLVEDDNVMVEEEEEEDGGGSGAARDVVRGYADESVAYRTSSELCVSKVAPGISRCLDCGSLAR